MAKSRKDIDMGGLITPNLDGVEKAAAAIHRKTDTSKPKKKPEKRIEVETTVRVTVDTPQSWHKAIKLHKLQQDDTDSIRQFYLDAVEAHCKKLGIKLK